MEVYLLKLCAFCTITFVAVLGKAEYKKRLAISCYGDVCNLDNTHQYCSESFKFCRNCEEVKDDCGTTSQPPACNGFCIEIAVKEAQKSKENEGTSCVVVPMMLNIANGVVSVPSETDNYVEVGTNLTYSCNEGYSLQGAGKIMCIGNGTWDQSVMPYCLDNTCLNYKQATIALSITCAVCLLGLTMLFGLYRKLQKIKAVISRQSTQNSIQNEGSPLIDDTRLEPDANDTPTFQMGTPTLIHPGIGLRADDNGKSIQLPVSPTPPGGLDVNVKDKAEESVGTNCSSQERRVAGINVNVFIQNEVQQSVGNIPQTPPETSENESEEEKDRVLNGQTFTKKENIDVKLSTEESREINPHEETVQVNKDKGTKPLPARDENIKHSEDTLKEQGNKGPDVLPVEDVEFQLSASETDQGHISKKYGFNDITFAKSDIPDRRGEPQGNKDIDLLMKQTETSQQMFEMKGIKDKETVSIDDGTMDTAYTKRDVEGTQSGATVIF